MVTASHNPHTDNGLKIISNEGGKLSVDEEIRIESFISEDQELPEGCVESKIHKAPYVDAYIQNLKKWFNFKYEIIYFYNVYGPNQIMYGDMATVIGIFEDHYKRKKPLPVVKPGTQTRRFTHIDDTIQVCYIAWKKNLCRHYSISHKQSFSILEVAKMFKHRIRLLSKRPGERYASALTTMNLSNKVYKHFGKIKLRDYIKSFIYSN